MAGAKIAAEEMSEKVLKKISGAIDNVCESNSPIVKNLFGGAEFAGNILKNEGDNFGQTLKMAAKETFEDEAGKLNYGKIAGSYIGASAAYRVASGGGLTRDKNGNADIIGIPFV